MRVSVFLCEYCPAQWLMNVTESLILMSFRVTSVLVPLSTPNDDVINLFFTNGGSFNIFLLVSVIDPGPTFVSELSLLIF
jgi:hypothetical protein